jgi:hypothetical protein
MKSHVGAPSPARNHCPTPRSRSSAQSAGLPVPLPVGEMGGLAELPSSGAGWTAVPGAGVGLSWTGPSLLGARAPCGGPVPPPYRGQRSRLRRATSRDRRDQELQLSGAAQVPGPRIDAASKGFENCTTASRAGTRPRRTRPEQAWARVGNGRPDNHDICGLYPTRPPSARRSGSTPNRLRVRPRAGVGQEVSSRGRRAHCNPGYEAGPRGGGSSRRRVEGARAPRLLPHPPIRATHPVDGSHGRKRGASAGGAGEVVAGRSPHDPVSVRGHRPVRRWPDGDDENRAPRARGGVS